MLIVKKGEKDNAHSMSFITCNRINYFYDNENGMIQFNWKLYFQKIMTEQYNSVLFSEEIDDKMQFAFLLKKDKKLYNIDNDNLVEFTNKKAKHYKYIIDEFVFIEKKKADSKLEYVKNSYEFLVYNALINNNYDQILNYLDIQILNINDLYYNDNNIYGFMLINNIMTSDKFELFKKYKIKLENKNNEGLTVLNLACVRGYLDIVKYLIEQSANINTLDNDHMTPLNNAVYRGYLEIVIYLLSKNADCKIPDKDNKLPIENANHQKHLSIEKELIKYCK
jgi:ankyrin repeat protein